MTQQQQQPVPAGPRRDLTDDGGFSDLSSLRTHLSQARGNLVNPANPPSAAPALEAGTRAAITGTTATIGFAAGVKAGMPFVGVPVVGPAIPVATGLGFMLLGGYAGEKAAEGAFNLRSAEKLPAEQRSRGVFGENIGGTIGMAGSVYGASASGVRFAEQGVGKYLNSIIESAKSRPVLFGAVETTGGVSAGLAGAAAESADSGNTLLRSGAELTAGALNPVWRTINLFDFARNTFITAQSKYSAGAQQDLIAKQLITAMRESGEDPALVVKALRQQMPKEFEELLTAGQKTGSSVLIGFERGLYEHSGKFGNDAREKTQAVMDLINVQIGILARSGDPRALQDIAKLRQARYETLIANRLESASFELVTTISRVARGGAPADKPALSVTAKNTLNQVYDEVRVIENDLWSKINNKVEVPLTNLMAARQEILDATGVELRGQKIPPYLERAIQKQEKAKGAIFDYDPDTFVIRDPAVVPSQLPSLDLISYRKELGDEIRAAVIAGQDSRAMELQKLHDAIMKDLDSVYSTLGDGAYNAARGFTKAKHDVFSRSFVGMSDGVTKTGERMPPEMMLDRALSGGPIQADIRLRDLERASRFLEDRGLGSPGGVETMLETQEQFYRIVTASSLNKDGRIDPNKVREYIEKNAVLLNRHPFNEIKTDLQEALKSEQGLRRLEQMAKNRDTTIGRNSAFAQIVKTDPVAYSSRILMNTRDQEKSLVSMFNLARKGGAGVTPEEGIRSARASIIAAAMNRSMRGDELNLETFKGLLFTPNVPGQKSVIDVMREQGVIDAKHIKNMETMFGILDNVVKSRTLGQPIQVEPGAGEIGIVLASKVAASKAASAVQSAAGSSGSQLIVHAAVANAAERLVSKIPQGKTKDMAVLLFNDPRMLAIVLERNLSPNNAQDMVKLRQLNAWAIQSGLLNPALSFADMDQEQRPQPPTMFSLPQ